MIPFIEIGPLALPAKPLLIIIGLYGAMWLVEKTAVRLNQSPDLFGDWALKATIAGFVGARLVFVALQWDIYLRSPIGIIWPITAGYTVWAGWLCAIAVWLVYGRIKQQSLWTSADVFILPMLFFFIMMRLADWFGGPGFGARTELFGLQRHWVQFYDIGVGLIAMFVWWQAMKQSRWGGWLALVTTAVFSFGMLFTLPLRGDSWLIGSGWHGNQLITLIIMVTAFGLLIFFSHAEEAKREIIEESP